MTYITPYVSWAALNDGGVVVIGDSFEDYAGGVTERVAREEHRNVTLAGRAFPMTFRWVRL